MIYSVLVYSFFLIPKIQGGLKPPQPSYNEGSVYCCMIFLVWQHFWSTTEQSHLNVDFWEKKLIPKNTSYLTCSDFIMNAKKSTEIQFSISNIGSIILEMILIKRKAFIEKFIFWDTLFFWKRALLLTTPGKVSHNSSNQKIISINQTWKQKYEFCWLLACAPQLRSC